jgi:hypothetical protein
MFCFSGRNLTERVAHFVAHRPPGQPGAAPADGPQGAARLWRLKNMIIPQKREEEILTIVQKNAKKIVKKENFE